MPQLTVLALVLACGTHALLERRPPDAEVAGRGGSRAAGAQQDSSGPAASGATPAPPAPRSPALEPESQAPQTPLTVRWKVVSDRGGRLVAEAVVERHARLRSPVTVRVELPKGLTLVSGQRRFEVADADEAGSTTRRFEFSYSGRAPAGDLKLIADAGTHHSGVHATDAYRFGRAVVEPARPTPQGPRVKFGEKDLGPAVPLDPAK